MERTQDDSSRALPDTRPVWSAPALAVRSGLIGLLVFMVGSIALVPLGNRKLAGVFWVGAAVNLALFCGVSLAAPIVLLRRVRHQVATPLRRVACVLAYTLGWLILPCAGLISFAGPNSRLSIPAWQFVVLGSIVGALFVMAAVAATLRPRRIE